MLALYGIIKEIIDLDIDEDLLSIVNDIYLESRYPGEIGLLDNGSMPTIEQANLFFNFAKQIQTKINGKLKENNEMFGN